jgi:hypothetical protein
MSAKAARKAEMPQSADADRERLYRALEDILQAAPRFRVAQGKIELARCS